MSLHISIILIKYTRILTYVTQTKQKWSEQERKSKHTKFFKQKNVEFSGLKSYRW